MIFDAIGGMGAGLASVIQGLIDRGDISAGAKIEVGSYVGTGEDAGENEITLTFGCIPAMVILTAYAGSGSYPALVVVSADIPSTVTASSIGYATGARYHASGWGTNTITISDELDGSPYVYVNDNGRYHQYIAIA